MPDSRISSKPITIEHVRIVCANSFEEVKATLSTELPELDARISQMLVSGDQEGVEEIETHGPRLFRFLERDHGALLQIAGQTRKAIQYEIGNPITASKMTRHTLGAALYAPLRVALFETKAGEVVFEYDRPSSLFGQFDDDRVLEVGLYLDKELESVLLRVSQEDPSR